MKKVAVCVLALLFGSGCFPGVMSLVTTPKIRKVYSGTRMDLIFINQKTGSDWEWAILDFPGSLIIDTAFLPFTLLCEAFGWTDEEAWEKLTTEYISARFTTQDSHTPPCGQLIYLDINS